MTQSLEQIELLLNAQTYLLEDSEEDGEASYGLMADIYSIEQGIDLAKQQADSYSDEQLQTLKTMIRAQLWQILDQQVSVSDEELAEHGYDEYDYESIGYLYREIEDNPKFAIGQLTSSWLCDDPQTVLVEIIGSCTSITPRLFAAEQLEALDSISIHGEIKPVLFSCFDQYDPDDRPYGQEERFFAVLTRIITSCLFGVEDISNLLKRTKQYQQLNEYHSFDHKTIDWYIQDYHNTDDQEQRLEILKALAYEWDEKAGLFDFLQQLDKTESNPKALGLIVKILFLNFPYHSDTIERIRACLTIDSDPQYFELWDYDIQTILDNYSDNDLPQKRQYLEHLIRERIGDIHLSIKVYTRSYGMTESTFKFFVERVEAVKSGHKTGILNLFLNNFPDNEQTQMIRRRYRKYL